MHRPDRRSPNYGKGTHQIDSLTTNAVFDPAKLVEQIRAELSAPGYQPPMLPEVALELMALVSDPNVGFKRIQQLVQSEPFIAAKVLQLAQSAAYSRGAPISSLDDAIRRLGLKRLMDLFLQASMSAKIFRAKGFDGPMMRLRRHSVLVGHATRLICRVTSFPDEYAFMCGLLHDVGIAAGLIILSKSGGGNAASALSLTQSTITNTGVGVTDLCEAPSKGPCDQVPRGARRVAGAREPTSPAPGRRNSRSPQVGFTTLELPVLEASLLAAHEQASSSVAKFWSLPADVQLVLGYHHRFRIDGRVHPLAAAICLADWIVSELGEGFGSEADEASAVHAAGALNVGQGDIARIRAALPEFVETA